MFPHGDVHVLTSAPGLSPLLITTDDVVKLTRPDSIANVRYGGGGRPTRFICGFFACDDVLSAQLIARLPKLINCEIGADSAAALLLRSLQPSKAAARPGQAAALAKLSELLFVDAIQGYVESWRRMRTGSAVLRIATSAMGLRSSMPGQATTGRWNRSQELWAFPGLHWRSTSCDARGWRRCNTSRSGVSASQPMRSAKPTGR